MPMPVLLSRLRSAALVAALAAIVSCDGEAPVATTPPTTPDPAAAARGQYLANAANCVGCHTDKEHGGALFAGGKAVDTPFGAYYSHNITPDPVNGIGAWSDADFLRALRRGVSPTGAHYFPAFPYTSFTRMTDDDIRDIHAYLLTLTPEPTKNRPHDVSFPYDVRLTMVPWRMLYFTPGVFQPDPNHDATWNRGAYLVTAVAHCGECHTPRDFLGAVEDDRAFGGGTLYGPGAKHAPNITPDPADGIGKWSLDNIVTVLKFGQLPNGDFVSAPMSEVVTGTAKLTDADRMAIAVYVKSLPPVPGKGG
ncbi:MAG: cytochrome c [Alphaproteobacteria bacterium]|nr:cytochrome c [Alphaproteobacteria bacterium]